MNSKLQNDINTVVAGVQDVQIAIGEVSKGTTSDNVEQLAQVADQEHGQLNDMKDQIAIDAPNNNGGYDLTNAVNELKNTMAAIGTYTGNPNPSTEASMVNQYKQAVSDWDNAVGEIYSGTSSTPPSSLGS